MYDDTKFRKRAEREFRFVATGTTLLAGGCIGCLGYMFSNGNLPFALLVGVATAIGTLLYLYSDPPHKPLY